MLTLDHITVAAACLADGVAHVEAALGVSIPAGGRHPLMATHNHLLALGEGLFLEVIAPDPDAPPPSRPRWFGLDDPALRASLAASPRLLTWVVRTPSIAAALARLSPALGPAIRLTRGDLSWLISIPEDGSVPEQGACPTVIEWPPGPHPAARMTDHGCRLTLLEIEHPAAAALDAALSPLLGDDRVWFRPGPVARLTATLATPAGPRVLR